MINIILVSIVSHKFYFKVYKKTRFYLSNIREEYNYKVSNVGLAPECRYLGLSNIMKGCSKY